MAKRRREPRPIRKFVFIVDAIVVVWGGQTFMPATERMLIKAYDMYASRAYTHQYTQQGMPPGDFENAFAQVEDCLAHYRTI